jgi:hypothetical protein
MDDAAAPFCPASKARPSAGAGATESTIFPLSRPSLNFHNSLICTSSRTQIAGSLMPSDNNVAICRDMAWVNGTPSSPAHGKSATLAPEVSHR